MSIALAVLVLSFCASRGSIGSGARVPPRSSQGSTLVAGRVVLPGGRAAPGALVTSSTGGRTAADHEGSFELVVDVPPEARELDLHAIAPGGVSGQGLSARLRVSITSLGVVNVGTIRLGPVAREGPTWLRTLGEQPGVSKASGSAWNLVAAAVFDDGSGPALYVGGSFAGAGNVGASGVARWDGSDWSAVGGGIDGQVNALCVYDDGAGPALFAGGWFHSAGGVTVSSVARWDGTAWSDPGGGIGGDSPAIPPHYVNAMAVFDDGGGPALYVGGFFSSAGSGAAASLAKWDGTTWSPLGSGLSVGSSNGVVETLLVHDDGTGPVLCVGGFFSQAGGASAPYIASWNGVSWSPLGGGMNDKVNALAVFDDGNGPDLYAGGIFTAASGTPAAGIARWNGSSWTSLATVPGTRVGSMTTFDLGTGPELVVGLFQGSTRVERWSGSSWSALGGEFDSGVHTLLEFEDGDHSDLIAVGAFPSGSDGALSCVARWNGTRWTGLTRGLNERVRCTRVFDDGTGPALFVGGEFWGSGHLRSSALLRWNGWTASSIGDVGWSFGPTLQGVVRCMTEFDSGTGPSLVVGGNFDQVDDVPASRIAAWDGSTWTALGGLTNHDVWSLASVNLGSGPRLFAGGEFTTVGAVNANRIGVWNGSTWSPLGDGLNGVVHALQPFDDGTGPAVYAAGQFTSAGGVPASRVARWNGASWSSLGGGLSDVADSLAVFDDGTGPALYAAGSFTSAGGVSAEHVARWDGSSWAAVGGGTNGSAKLKVVDDGNGPALYAWGAFTSAGGTAADGLARWDGTSWSTVPGASWTPYSNGVTVLEDVTRFDGPDGEFGPTLYFGGSFLESASGDSFLTRWGPPPGHLGRPDPGEPRRSVVGTTD